MNVEDKKRLLRRAQIRSIRAVHLALSVLLEAGADIVANFAGDPSGDEPEEIEQARVKAWNTIGPLLIMGAKSIMTFAKCGDLGADVALEVIEQCESALKVLEQDEAAERFNPYLEKLLADPDNKVLRLQASLWISPRKTFRP
jgi:hypothetical protein